MKYLTFFIYALWASSLAAQDPKFGLPIDCDLDGPCYIQQFVDHNTDASARDFQCGSLSYDGHKGTDFALPSTRYLNNSVRVFAAAPGTVTGVRNDMDEHDPGDYDLAAVEGKECGNGVVISHGGGWETQYCHMAKGSVTVVAGQKVMMGSVLGIVGLSGATEFPHLHLSVRHKGKVIDPFSPQLEPDKCGQVDQTLWLEPPQTPPGGIITAGFTSLLPDFLQIKAGLDTPETLAPDDNLVLWAYIFGGRSGDILSIKINNSSGQEVVAKAEILERTQAQLYRASGRRPPENGWPPGHYSGFVSLIRDGILIDSLEKQITVQ